MSTKITLEEILENTKEAIKNFKLYVDSIDIDTEDFIRLIQKYSDVLEKEFKLSDFNKTKLRYIIDNLLNDTEEFISNIWLGAYIDTIICLIKIGRISCKLGLSKGQTINFINGLFEKEFIDNDLDLDTEYIPINNNYICIDLILELYESCKKDEVSNEHMFIRIFKLFSNYINNDILNILLNGIDINKKSLSENIEVLDNNFYDNFDNYPGFLHKDFIIPEAIEELFLGYIKKNM